MKSLLVIAGDRALTKFIAETLLGRKIERGGPPLKGSGWHLHRAHTGIEGLLMVTKSEQRFDALLVDQQLPDRELLPFLDQLRKTPHAESIPIFVMSERGRDQLTRKMATESYQVAGFIDRPVTADTLRRGLRTLERVRLVLIVEPDPKKAKDFERELISSGFLVQTAATGKDALARVHESRPDAVVSALGLADVPGSELCVQLKRDAATHSIPVLLHGEIDDMATAEIEENAYRADGFLRQPVSGKMMADRIMALVGRAASIAGGKPETEPPASGPAPKTPGAQTLEERQPPRRRVPSATGDEMGFGDGQAMRNVAGTSRRKVPVEVLDESETEASANPARAHVSPPPTSASPPPHGPAKRSTRRVPCSISVSFRDGGTIFRSETLNISNGGILIATDHPLEIGTHIDLTLELPTQPKPIMAVGKVAWIQRSPTSDAQSAGVGVKFSKIDPADLRAVVDYVNNVSKLVYVAP